jgi:hypothetical protein
MRRKETLTAAGLLCIIALFTAFAVGSQPQGTATGTFVQYVIPAIFTLWLLGLVTNARAIMELLASFFLRKRKQQDLVRSWWGILMGYVMVLVLILILFRTQFLLNLIGAMANAVASTGVFVPNAQMQGAQVPAMANSPLLSYTLLVFGGVILVSLALFFGGLRTAYGRVRDGYSASKTVSARTEAIKIVQKASMNLRLARDYRETILNCYRQMCLVLANHGFSIGLEETAREFSEKVSRSLQLEADAVKGLTLLFEQARYSDHEIDDQQRSLALARLESLEHQLAADS